MTIANHLERHLGRIQSGWSDASSPGIQVCRFADRPVDGVTTYASLGLSTNELMLPRGRRVRQEVLLAMREPPTPEASVGKLMLAIAESLLEHRRAILRGDVLRLRDVPADAGVPSLLYATVPVVFSDGLATFGESEPATVVVWLIPLCLAEAEFIKTAGWSAFEDKLEAVDPDLFDLSRRSIV